MNKKNKLPAANNRIRAEKVRVVDDKGEMLGVLGLNEAILKAKSLSLDLVEVSPNASPPVCKILDYGKYKYELQKRAAEAKKKQKTVEIKEIKIRPNIGDNDYNIKLKATSKFLQEGNKVKISMRFRGREIAKQEIARNIFLRVKEDTDELAKIEVEPKMEMRQLLMILAPK
ncbi:MAG: translation initiation factor IF-3 [Alphaproteobacteria bacterium]|jgi:translation initiation factor IF-3|nr:translation initiation factor IF-3 [Alphaproteobacteria bacterium]MBT5827881.1 translation initiation factor IF-3 [Alphaproteobacteria bacterium]